MFVGAGIVKFKIPYSNSLKEKRAVVNSVKRKIANSFPVSVAEVGDLDLLNSAEIGFSIVSHDKNYIFSKIEKLLDYINTHFDIVILNEDFELYYSHPKFLASMKGFSKIDLKSSKEYHLF